MCVTRDARIFYRGQFQRNWQICRLLLTPIMLKTFQLTNLTGAKVCGVWQKPQVEGSGAKLKAFKVVVKKRRQIHHLLCYSKAEQQTNSSSVFVFLVVALFFNRVMLRRAQLCHIVVYPSVRTSVRLSVTIKYRDHIR